MAYIKVKQGGVGVKYIDAHGNERHALKTPESGPFECDDAQAARFVELGAAEYVGAQEAPMAQVNEQQDEGQQSDEQQEETGEPSQEPEKVAHHLDAEQLKNMTVAQLKTLAEDMGADISGCKKKDDYIAAIVAVDVYIDDEDDELPDLSAADPE